MGGRGARLRLAGGPVHSSGARARATVRLPGWARARTQISRKVGALDG